MCRPILEHMDPFSIIVGALIITEFALASISHLRDLFNGLEEANDMIQDVLFDLEAIQLSLSALKELFLLLPPPLPIVINSRKIVPSPLSRKSHQPFALLLLVGQRPIHSGMPGSIDIFCDRSSVRVAFIRIIEPKEPPLGVSNQFLSIFSFLIF